MGQSLEFRRHRPCPSPLYGAFLVKKFKQSGALFFDRQFLCSIRMQSESPSLLIEPSFTHAGARRSCTRLAVTPTLRHASPLPGHTLTVPSTPWCDRDEDQRGARFRARFTRATTLYPVGPWTRTMMQSCASAAKLRSGGPILSVGMKAKGLIGIPPPRTVIGAPSQAYEQGRNCRGAVSILRLLCQTQNDAVGYNALPHQPP